VSELAIVLDDGYVPLGGAANRLSREFLNCTAGEVMDLLKTAVFNGEFDDGPEDIGETGYAWLKTASETAPRRYGFTRCSVVRMLIRMDGLPRDPAVRESLFDVIAIVTEEDSTYHVLARTPFDEYPEQGRRELEALMVRRSVLASFIRSQYRVFSLLSDSSNPHRQLPSDALPHNQAIQRLQNVERVRGRPRKAAWPRIVGLVRQLRNEHPALQKKRLAFEAWRRACQEFGKSELLSVHTIQRHMAEILS